MRTFQNKKILFTPGFAIYLAFLVLLLPLQWLFLWLVAAAVHELSHIFALKLTGVNVCGITVSNLGIQMNIGPISPGKELFVAAAGPLGGLCLLIIRKWIPGIAACATIQSLFNLLPIYPLDGGRILCTLLVLLHIPNYLHKCIMRTVQVITIVGLLTLCYSVYVR